VLSAGHWLRSHGVAERAPRSRLGPACRNVRARDRGWRDRHESGAGLGCEDQCRQKAPRALTPRETAHLTALLAASPRAVELDLVDVVDWMLATGCRIGEALATRYSANANGKSLLDLEAGTWEVNATVVRMPWVAWWSSRVRRALPAGGWSPFRGLPFGCLSGVGRWARTTVSSSPRRSPASCVIRTTSPAICANYSTRSNASSVPTRTIGSIVMAASCSDRVATASGVGRSVVLGHLAHLPQDGRHATGRGRIHATPGCRSARPREPVDDTRRVLRSPGRERRCR
jgi:hypothetical protein